MARTTFHSLFRFYWNQNNTKQIIQNLVFLPFSSIFSPTKQKQQKKEKKIFPIKRNTSQGFIGRIQERESEEKNEKPEKSVEREGEKDSMYHCEVADVRAWVRTDRSSPRGEWNQLKS